MIPDMKLEGNEQKNKIHRLLPVRTDSNPNHKINMAATNANCRINRIVFFLFENTLFIRNANNIFLINRIKDDRSLTINNRALKLGM